MNSIDSLSKEPDHPDSLDVNPPSQFLELIGGEALEGTGFEEETPEPGFDLAVPVAPASSLKGDLQ